MLHNLYSSEKWDCAKARCTCALLIFQSIWKKRKSKGTVTGQTVSARYIEVSVERNELARCAAYEHVSDDRLGGGGKRILSKGCEGPSR